MSRTTLVGAALVTAGLVGCGPSYDDEPSRAPTECAGTRGEIVFALTAADTQILADGSRRSTGFFLGEFYEAYRALVEAGYRAVIVTPGARPPSSTPRVSTRSTGWSIPVGSTTRESSSQRIARFAAPVSLAEVQERSETFEGVVVPGGRGVVVDLIEDRALQQLIIDHRRTGRVVGLICHAPAILIRIHPASDPFAGRRVTSVSGVEASGVSSWLCSSGPAS